MNEEKKKEEKKNKEEACEKCQEYLHGWKRALADYDNLKKELSTERVRMRQGAIEQTVHQLIPVLDHFDHALRFKPEGVDASVENWLQGVLHVRTQLESVFVEMGLEPFGKEGDMFDPHMHEAASEEIREDTTSGIILQIVERGWKRGEHILRPAKVIVSK